METAFRNHALKVTGGIGWSKTCLPPVRFSRIFSYDVIELIKHFSALAANYDVVLCDVWGVTHNGISAFPKACDALARFRAGGGAVVLVTNAPRRGEAVSRQLDQFGVPRAAYDGIVSSGDVTCGVMAERPGQSVFHLGPQRDISIFEGLGTRFAPADEADYVVCTGLFNDEVETPESYHDMLALMRRRKLFMVCGNPDVVVERGDKLVYCAGAIADLYGSLGGDVLYAGKPYRPIYEMALAKAQSARAVNAPLSRVLAIGDSVRTDLKGAADFGIDCLFVTAGIHAEELGGRDDPDLQRLDGIFAKAGIAARAVMRTLVW
jgi:HAD superfamily hydrolase (TIGR01459 family)